MAKKFRLITRNTYFSEDEPLFDSYDEAYAAMEYKLRNDPTNPVQIDQVMATFVGSVTVSQMPGDDDASDGGTSDDDGDASESKTGTKKA
ncbi:hypothetical protein [Carnimonas bestiolae]|uniref:hypothetical protein n=1 Tax=Carnimonas bestiolae TaxID=3402172 RepID=UPI003EDCA12D